MLMLDEPKREGRRGQAQLGTNTDRKEIWGTKYHVGTGGDRGIVTLFTVLLMEVRLTSRITTAPSDTLFTVTKPSADTVAEMFPLTKVLSVAFAAVVCAVLVDLLSTGCPLLSSPGGRRAPGLSTIADPPRPIRTRKEFVPHLHTSCPRWSMIDCARARLGQRMRHTPPVHTAALVSRAL